MKIMQIEGIGNIYAETLQSKGIRTVKSLLKAAADRKGRRELSEQTGIAEKKILEWANRADLMRVKGVGEEYSDLLEAAGVDTVRELAYRRPDNLHKTLVEVNKEKRLVRRIPTLNEVERWVERAQNLPPAISH